MKNLIDTIVLPIASTYVGNWGLWEGIREIWQNAADQEEISGQSSVLEWQPEAGEKIGHIVITSGGKLTPGSLVLGNSTKKDDHQLRGKHGEGYKLAMLALIRAGYVVVIENGDEMWVPSLKYSEKFKTECLTIEVLRVEPKQTQQVSFRVGLVSVEDWTTVKSNILENAPYGILDSATQKGRVYVGGLYVCTVEEFECGYSFLPEELELDRDRGLVSTYELQGLAANLWNSRKDSHKRAVELLKSGRPDVAYLHHRATSSSPIVTAVKEDFEKEHGVDTMPVSSQEEIKKAQAAGVKWVLVPQAIKTLLAMVRNVFIPSVKPPLERLKDLAKEIHYHVTEDHRKELAGIIEALS